jgi:hypothetical protein
MSNIQHGISNDEITAKDECEIYNTKYPIMKGRDKGKEECPISNTQYPMMKVGK